MEKQLVIILLFIPFLLQAQYKIPGRIEAEGMTSFKTAVIKSDTTTDGSGGRFVTMTTNSWSSYYINITTAGRYKMGFRVGDGSGGARVQVRKSDGSIIDSFTTAPTGGLKVWATQSLNVDFPAGKQTIRLFDIFGEFNLDWIEITSVPPDTSLVSRNDIEAIDKKFILLQRTIDSLKNVVNNNVILFNPKYYKWDNGMITPIENKTDTLIVTPLRK